MQNGSKLCSISRNTPQEAPYCMKQISRFKLEHNRLNQIRENENCTHTSTYERIKEDVVVYKKMRWVGEEEQKKNTSIEQAALTPIV
jgi:hypothetical protein